MDRRALEDLANGYLPEPNVLPARDIAVDPEGHLYKEKREGKDRWFERHRERNEYIARNIRKLKLGEAANLYLPHDLILDWEAAHPPPKEVEGWIKDYLCQEGIPAEKFKVVVHPAYHRWAIVELVKYKDGWAWQVDRVICHPFDSEHPPEDYRHDPMFRHHLEEGTIGAYKAPERWDFEQLRSYGDKRLAREMENKQGLIEDAGMKERERVLDDFTLDMVEYNADLVIRAGQAGRRFTSAWDLRTEAGAEAAGMNQAGNSEDRFVLERADGYIRRHRRGSAEANAVIEAQVKKFEGVSLDDLSAMDRRDVDFETVNRLYGVSRQQLSKRATRFVPENVAPANVAVATKKRQEPQKVAQ